MATQEDYREKFMKTVVIAEGHILAIDYEEARKFHKIAKAIYNLNKKQLSDLLPRLNRLEEVLGINKISDEGGTRL